MTTSSDATADLYWAAASGFVRDVIEALGHPQPAPDSVVNLSAIALQVVGQIEELKTQNAHLLAALKHVERHCPCGARPETPHTHPHVLGCQVGIAIAKAEGR